MKSNNITNSQKKLIRTLSRKNSGVYVNVEARMVFQSNELSHDEFLGILPKKLIPNRKMLEKKSRERKQNIERKSLEEISYPIEYKTIEVSVMERFKYIINYANKIKVKQLI